MNALVQECRTLTTACVFCMAHCVCLFNIKTTYHAPEQDSIILLSSELVGVGGGGGGGGGGRHLAIYYITTIN